MNLTAKENYSLIFQSFNQNKFYVGTHANPKLLPLFILSLETKL